MAILAWVHRSKWAGMWGFSQACVCGRMWIAQHAPGVCVCWCSRMHRVCVCAGAVACTRNPSSQSRSHPMFTQMLALILTH